MLPDIVNVKGCGGLGTVAIVLICGTGDPATTLKDTPLDGEPLAPFRTVTVKEPLIASAEAPVSCVADPFNPVTVQGVSHPGPEK